MDEIASTSEHTCILLRKCIALFGLIMGIDEVMSC